MQISHKLFASETRNPILLEKEFNFAFDDVRKSISFH